MFRSPYKPKKVKKEDYEFLQFISKKLVEKYPYLEKQVNKEFILKKRLEPAEDGTYSLILNAQLEKNYLNKNLPRFFLIQNIRVWNKRKGDYDLINFHIVEGMLVGYRVKARTKDLDLTKIDVSRINEKHFSDIDKANLLEVFNGISTELEMLLDIKETFTIEIPEGKFYTIKNLGDGNYLAINDKGSIYSLEHDPYEVKEIFKDKDSFIAAIKSGEFKL